MGEGFTVEEQVTGEAKHGGIQIDVFPRQPENPGSFVQYHSWISPEAPLTTARTLVNYLIPQELGLPLGSKLGIDV